MSFDCHARRFLIELRVIHEGAYHWHAKDEGDARLHRENPSGTWRLPKSRTRRAAHVRVQVLGHVPSEQAAAALAGRNIWQRRWRRSECGSHSASDWHASKDGDGSIRARLHRAQFRLRPAHALTRGAHRSTFIVPSRPTKADL